MFVPIVAWMRGETATDTPLDPLVLEGLRSFNAQCRLKTAVLRLMSDTLQPHELDSLHTTFESMDEDKDGSITIAELTKAMKAVAKDHRTRHVSRHSLFPCCYKHVCIPARCLFVIVQ